MKQFLKRLWQSPLKGFLILLPAVSIGIVVNHLTGPSGQVQLPAQSATDLLMIFVGIVGSVCGVAYSYYEKLEALKKEHEEEVQVRDGIVFKRGKRTGGIWMAFCPVCERPADTTILVKCPDTKCKWQAIKSKKQIDEIISHLPP
jgi:hypothetical protein